MKLNELRRQELERQNAWLNAKHVKLSSDLLQKTTGQYEVGATDNFFSLALLGDSVLGATVTKPMVAIEEFTFFTQMDLFPVFLVSDFLQTSIQKNYTVHHRTRFRIPGMWNCKAYF